MEEVSQNFFVWGSELPFFEDVSRNCFVLDLPSSFHARSKYRIIASFQIERERKEGRKKEKKKEKKEKKRKKKE
jgi:hypothetical protein